MQWMNEWFAPNSKQAKHKQNKPIHTQFTTSKTQPKTNDISESNPAEVKMGDETPTHIAAAAAAVATDQRFQKLIS